MISSNLSLQANNNSKNVRNDLRCETYKISASLTGEKNNLRTFTGNKKLIS